MKTQLLACLLLWTGYAYAQSIDFNQFSAHSDVHISALKENFIYTVGEPINRYIENNDATIRQGLLHSSLRKTVTDKTTVQIQVFVDENGNGIKDADDRYTIQGKIDIEGEDLIQIIDTDGIFYYALPGSYTFAYISNNPAYGPTTSFYETVEVKPGEKYIQVLFGIKPNELKERAHLSFSLEPFRCFRRTSNTLTATNLGSYKIEQTVFLEVDNRLSDFWPLETPDIVVNDHLVGWDISLEAGESKDFDYDIQVPDVTTATDIGVSYRTKSWMALQNSPDQISNRYQILRCAYDPNDKLVEPNRPDSLALLDNPLTYTIRFQNTGNDVADDVVVADTMDTRLDMNTFRIINSSHPDQLAVAFDKDNEHIVNFRFEGIYLPDSTTNEPGSNGHVTYLIETEPDLPNNTVIENTAHIYFDFNPAIVTNTTGTTLVDSFPPLGEDVIMEISQVICAGDSYEGYQQAGEYTDIYPLPNGYDSIRTLKLYTIPLSTELITQTICAGESYEGYNTSGMYVDTLSQGHCSSIREITLTVEEIYEKHERVELCNDDFHGEYSGSGTIVDRYTSTTGCDSFVITEIIVSSEYPVIENIIICEGEQYDGYDVTGIHETTSLNSRGCDSLHIIDMTVLPSSSSTIEVSICRGETYEGYDNSGSYKDVYVNYLGCDSTRILDLTILDKANSFIQIQLCKGEAFEQYIETGTYTDIYVASNGCDSIRTLDLVIKNTVESYETTEICEGETYNGYNETGTYSTIYSGINGCDSTHILDLKVLENPESLLAKEICEGENYDGYTATGLHIDVFTANNGCDSTRRLQLLVLPNQEKTVQLSLCRGESYEGYTESGSYTDSYFGINGCDSTRYLELTILEPTLENKEIYLCPGENHEGLTDEGIYSEYYTNAVGCDSIKYIEIIKIDHGDPICAFQYDDDPKKFSDTNFLSLYPNPAKAFINLIIDKPNRINSELKIFNVNKKHLNTVPINSKSSTIDISQLSSGVYIFILQNGNNLYTERVVVL